MAYNLRNIRALLNDGFTPEELRRICYDSRAFRPVYDSLPATDKGEIIDRLIEFAERRRLIPELLALAQASNPNLYAERQPYEVPDPIPVLPTPPRIPAPRPPNFGFTTIMEWIEQFVIWITTLSLILAAILSPLGLDNMAASIAFLITAAVFALAGLIHRSVPLSIKVVGSLLIIAAPIGVIYLWGWLSQPRFEITALDTLENDPNAYEVTDLLIWNKDNLNEAGTSITFTLEVRPIYSGDQQFGRVIALISGDAQNSPLVKPLWNVFSAESETQQIQLTLPELLGASGLKENVNPPSNPFRPGDIAFQQARLIVQIAREADRKHPWSEQEITIRNAPWEMQAGLVMRNNRREVDIYVKNLGGAGEFAVHYGLVRLEKDIGSDSSPMWSGTTSLNYWFDPPEFIYLDKGQFLTHTVAIPDQLAQGRYLIETYTIKRQNYVRFEQPGTWDDPNSIESPWSFSAPTQAQQLIFVVTPPEFTQDPIIQAEWSRLRDEQGIDLGLPLGNAEELTSGYGSKGLRQIFQGGEVYMHNEQAYTIYGPILEHYKALGGVQSSEIGFPIFPIQTITSSSGITGTIMEFEGNYALQSPAVIYASKKGVAGTWGLIGQAYLQNGGHTGWLGLPLADEQYFQDSTTIQMFEYGYIIYCHPLVGEERDWSRAPVVYPYLASRGKLFDVQAQQSWQDTGVQIQAEDRITIIQVGGEWSYWRDGGKFFDANGDYSFIDKDMPLPTASVGSLIGRVGNNSKEIFPIGRWSDLVAPADGDLFLAMNDNTYEDDDGFITVQIVVKSTE